MNLGELQAEVASICGNLPSAHPLYALFITPAAGKEDQSVINRAANKLITYAAGGNGSGADLFPELRNTWTAGPTVASQNYLSRPTDCLAITGVTSAQSASLPTWATTKEYPLNWTPIEDFAYLQKDSTMTGYAKLWTLKGKQVQIWPTPDSTHIDYLRYYGLKIENTLVNAADVFFMAPIWHDMVATLAAQMLSKKLGWYEQADALWTQFQTDLAAAVNVTAMEQQPVSLSVDGMPTRFSVSGV